jgi:predicted  nucleic acid-binding Zn-ribbon protein
MLTNNSDSDSSELRSPSDSLVAEINALQHELRRAKDALERAGGASHDLEKRARQLSKNIQLCESELKEYLR